MKTKITLIVALALALALAAGAAWISQRVPATGAATEARHILYYTCPMHPSVHADRPGDCVLCGMKLVPVYAGSIGTTNATSVPTPNSCCGTSCSPAAKP